MKRRDDNANWRSLDRSQAPRLWERVAEKAIFLISLTTILFVLLIFLFIGRESLPIILETSKAPFAGESIPVSNLDSTPPETIQRYLELSEEEYRSMERETIALLLEVKLEALAEAPVEGDVTIQSTRWRYLLRPFQWIGYDAPAYIWQPISQIPKYNIVPLLIGSLKTSITALILQSPLRSVLLFMFLNWHLTESGNGSSPSSN